MTKANKTDERVIKNIVSRNVQCSNVNDRLRGPTPNFGQKLQFFLLKKHPQVCGKYVPKF